MDTKRDDEFLRNRIKEGKSGAMSQRDQTIYTRLKLWLMNLVSLVYSQRGVLRFETDLALAL
jgi:hypothetical protein